MGDGGPLTEQPLARMVLVATGRGLHGGDRFVGMRECTRCVGTGRARASHIRVSARPLTTAPESVVRAALGEDVAASPPSPPLSVSDAVGPSASRRG